MHDDKDRPPTDIRKLFGPIEADGGPLGPIDVPIRTTGFLVWFEQQEKAKRWADGPSFVRAMLADQARKKDGGEAPGTDLVGALDGDAIEGVAANIVDAIGPSLIIRGRVRGQPEAGEAQPRPEMPGAPASERLLTTVRDYYEHHRTMMKSVTEQFLKNDSLATIRQALSATQQMTLETDRLRKLVEPLSAASKYLADRALLDGLRGLASTEFFEQQNLIARQVASLTAPLGSALALQDRFRPMIPPDLHQQIIGNQAAWARMVDSGFDLHLNAKMVADLAGTRSATLAAAESIARMIADSGLNRLGFQATANLALDGIIGRGAATDVLQRYAEANSRHSATFEAILEAVRSLDDEGDIADATGAAEQAWHRILSEPPRTESPLDLATKIALANLLVAVIAVLIGAAALYEQHNPSEPAALTGIRQELSAMRREHQAERATDASLRYVSGVVNLRAEPSRGAMLMRLIYPDQMVRILETKGEWAMVELIDYASGAPIKGWVNRRNLRVRPPS